MVNGVDSIRGNNGGLKQRELCVAAALMSGTLLKRLFEHFARNVASPVCPPVVVLKALNEAFGGTSVLERYLSRSLWLEHVALIGHPGGLDVDVHTSVG
jgi:hypothetical protein